METKKKQKKDMDRPLRGEQSALSTPAIDPPESTRENFPSTARSSDGQNTSSLDPFAAISAISAPYAELLQEEFQRTWKALERINYANIYTTESLVAAMHAQVLAFLQLMDGDQNLSSKWWRMKQTTLTTTGRPRMCYFRTIPSSIPVSHHFLDATIDEEVANALNQQLLTVNDHAQRLMGQPYNALISSSRTSISAVTYQEIN